MTDRANLAPHLDALADARVLCVGDAMLDRFSPTGSYAEIADVLVEWYGGLTSWITFPMPADPAHDADAAKVIAQLRGD